MDLLYFLGGLAIGGVVAAVLASLLSRRRNGDRLPRWFRGSQPPSGDGLLRYRAGEDGEGGSWIDLQWVEPRREVQTQQAGN
jgi:hypothetical protein